MRTIRLTLFVAVIPFMLSSCGKAPCESKNPIFNQFTPDTPAYQAELVRQLHIPSNNDPIFWFDHYESRDSKDYIFVEIRDKDLCATGMILIEDWANLKDIQRTKGEGYQGAELKGLHLLFQAKDGRTQLVFHDVDDIID